MKRYQLAIRKLNITITYFDSMLTFTRGHNYYIFKVNTLWLSVLALSIVFLSAYLVLKPKYIDQNLLENNARYEVMDNFLSSSPVEPVLLKETSHQTFIQNKAAIIYKYTAKNNVSRIDQLSAHVMLGFADEIADLFIEQVLKPERPAEHVWNFFVDTSELDKIKTAIIEQIKYHIPASIKLAQSALETGYGKRVAHNNYFGLKDKTNKTKPIYTIEYYNKKECDLNKNKIIWSQKVKKRGLTLYKCKVKDSFKNYKTPWHSFRDHSIYLNNERRYAFLFTKGKNYEAWANTIGSTRFGGVGYATSPVYGEVLKSIIQRYHLDLLDH